MIKKPKILIWDIETSLMGLASFGLKNDYIQPSNILTDWHIICACWKELGKNKVYAVSTLDDPKRFARNPHDDYYVIKTLRDLIAGYDIIVHHNGDSFDIKKLNARIIYHRLPPLPPILMVDTKKEACKIAKFSSNKLEYLAKHLGLENKLGTAPGLWLKVMRGDKKAIKDMVTYNKGDVVTLEQVYLALLPYMKSHPNVARGDTFECPKCGSDNVQLRGTITTRSGITYHRYVCKECGAWSRTRLRVAAKKSELTGA